MDVLGTTPVVPTKALSIVGELLRAYQSHCKSHAPAETVLMNITVRIQPGISKIHLGLSLSHLAYTGESLGSPADQWLLDEDWP